MLNKNNNLPLLSTLFLLFFVLNQSNGQSENELFISNSGTLLKFQKKKDLLFSIGGTKGKGYDHIHNFGQVQIGYSPINHISISLFHSRQKLFSKHSEETIFNQHQITGINIGTYFSLKYQLKRRKKRWFEDEPKYQRILFDFATGYSNGGLKNYYYRNNIPASNQISLKGFNEFNLQNIYIHSGIHFLFFNRIDISFSYKLGKVNYYKGKVESQGFGGIENRSNILNLANNEFHSFHETSAQLEIQKKGIGLFVKGTGSQVIGFGYNWYDFYAEVGLTLDIGKIKRTDIFNKIKNLKYFIK